MLAIPPAFFGALDLTVTVKPAADGSRPDGASSLVQPGIVLRGGLTLTVDFNTPFPTGNGCSMRTLSIVAARFRTTIAIIDTFRVVIDETTVEIFGSATPANFIWKTTNTSAALLGPGVFDVSAHQVAPAKVTS